MSQDKIWEAYQNDESLSNETWWPEGGRLKYIAKKIPKSARILNIGVGNGALETLLSQKGVDVSCLDPSSTSIERLREHLHLGKKARVGGSQSIPFGDSTFDIVIMTEVLEHLDDEILDATLDEVKRVLVSGGKFIGTVPADEDLILGLVVCPRCGERFHRWGHVQSFNKERLGVLLGSRFNYVSVTRVALGDFSRLNWKGKIIWALKVIQAGLGRAGGNQNFYFEAQNN